MWYHQYLGKPWVEYASGPDAFDCWGFVLLVLRERYGINDVPRCENIVIGDYTHYTATAEHIQATNVWERIARPIDGAVVLMGSPILIKHIGISEGGQILHCRHGAGVCIESEKIINDLGLSRIEYWKHDRL